MSRSIHSDLHRRLCRLLARSRTESGLTQAKLAARLRRPQSFVSKYERGERRLDVVELFEVAKAVGVRPSLLVQQLEDSR